MRKHSRPNAAKYWQGRCKEVQRMFNDAGVFRQSHEEWLNRALVAQYRREFQRGSANRSMSIQTGPTSAEDNRVHNLAQYGSIFYPQQIYFGGSIL